MPRPIHFEIHADDPQRAIAFYTGVFGWTVNQGPPEAGGYSIAELKGHLIVCGAGVVAGEGAVAAMTGSSARRPARP